MPPVRPKLSITLPRNFTFHYTEGQPPKTPERTLESEEPRQPSPPRYRIRRRPRANLSISSYEPFSLPTKPQDVPIPTIETSEPALSHPYSGNVSPEPEPQEGYLAPVPPRRHMSTPRTPLAQIQTGFDDVHASKDRVFWGQKAEPSPGESISRPSSACSGLSDSSESSLTSSASLPSTGGSCTSPESDIPDPFGLRSARKGKSRIIHASAADATSDDVFQTSHERSKKRKHSHWTAEMDSHLWATYLLYLQDPTMTPFKMLPGCTPPLGVCHRVAREAKQSWRTSKYAAAAAIATPVSPMGFSLDGNGKQVLRDVHDDNDDEVHAITPSDSPDTIKPSRSGSNTPTGASQTNRKPISKWPSSESATRKRLRELCKRKPTLSTHYQRLLHSRSPSPFHQSRSQSRSSRFSTPFGGFEERPAFGTRDMNMSLSTSTSTMMQPGNPLLQFAQEDNDRSFPEAEDNGWFQRAPISATLPVKQRQALSLGLGIGGLNGSNTFPRLGSPFHDKYHKREPLRTYHDDYVRPSPPRTESAPQTDSETATTNSYWSQSQEARSPMTPQLQEPLSYPSLTRRRARRQLEREREMSPKESDDHHDFVDELFGAPAEISHRRVRSRGFSLGDVGSAGRHYSLATPPPLYDRLDDAAFGYSASFDSTPALHSHRDRIQRLGSPFGGYQKPVLSSSTTLPDLATYHVPQTPSIQQRLDDYRDESVLRRKDRLL
ncbi:hypothetical protein L228DRAFT_239400 [Xylona heveae TC161]|uniref:Uncharacterized protein n=1 Tax=Xylona heveae (strain CBS 132557 / TC161) TaxID=1328760 RepID=A0A165GPF9_XYLHT|nr:hypothetical protein L228DRAFT_239400 [Xylona heveae TC161]KZF22434.1 hypothetical protein L228DRAFT_239400 [Xylona heveae TC161]